MPAAAAALAASGASLIYAPAGSLSGPSLTVGAFPTTNPFTSGSFTAVLDLTRSRRHAPARRAAAAAAAASAGAPPGAGGGAPRLLYLRCPMEDCASSMQRMLDALQATLLPFLLEAWRGGCRVLVHCEKGVSRSPTVAAALIMALHQAGALLEAADVAARGLARAALSFVKGKRRVARPNKGFRRVLRKLERIMVVVVEGA